jgi:hypothetical protein
MIIITRQSLAEIAPERWKRQYPDSALSFPPRGERTPEEIDQIISEATGSPNNSWTQPPMCSECDALCDCVIEVGEDHDRESKTAWLCKACALTAAVLIGQVR